FWSKGIGSHFSNCARPGAGFENSPAIRAGILGTGRSAAGGSSLDGPACRFPAETGGDGGDRRPIRAARDGAAGAAIGFIGRVAVCAAMRLMRPAAAAPSTLELHAFLDPRARSDPLAPRCDMLQAGAVDQR